MLLLVLLLLFAIYSGICYNREKTTKVNANLWRIRASRVLLFLKSGYGTVNPGHRYSIVKKNSIYI
jgi:hypothetical protein